MPSFRILSSFKCFYVIFKQNDQFFLPFSANLSQVAIFQMMPALCPHGQGDGGGGVREDGQPNVDRPGQGEGGPKNSQISADIFYERPLMMTLTRKKV